MSGSDLTTGMRHQFRIGWRTSRTFAIGAVATTVTLHALALFTAANYDAVIAAGITGPQLLPLAAGLWAALAVLPALGGGDSDDPMAVAAVGGGRSFMFGSRLAAALADVGPGLFVPCLALVGAAAAGWAGWLAGLVLAINGVAVGQLAGASSALVMRRIGPTWALLAISAFVLLIATVVAGSPAGPSTWWRQAVVSPTRLILLLATAVLALIGAWALTRPNDRALKAPREVRLPGSPLAALTVASVLGIGRSLSARSTVITAALAPLLVRAAGDQATGAIAVVVLAAAAAILGANGFAYDGGAGVWVLTKASHRDMVVSRWLATTTWLLVLSLVVCVSGLIIGAPVSAGVLPMLALVAVGAGAAGLVPSVRRPMPTDFDSFRTQAAPVVSAMGTLGRALAVTALAVFAPWWLAAAAILGYVAFAMWHAQRSLADPIALAALA